jgi:hypothetical protein
MKNKKDRFKKKGQSILDSRPNNMKDFLESQQDTQMHKDAIAQLHKTTETQKHNCNNIQDAFVQKHKYTTAQNRNYTNTQNSNGSNQNTGPEEVERIHVQITKQLADKLFAQIYARKREGKKATQRHIIEQALEEYFAK